MGNPITDSKENLIVDFVIIQEKKKDTKKRTKKQTKKRTKKTNKEENKASVQSSSVNKKGKKIFLF